MKNLIKKYEEKLKSLIDFRNSGDITRGGFEHGNLNGIIDTLQSVVEDLNNTPYENIEHREIYDIVQERLGKEGKTYTSDDLRNKLHKDLTITNIEIFGGFNRKDGERAHNGCLRISWMSSRGFGQYDILIDKENNLIGESECMDTNEDKSFIIALLKEFVNKIDIQEG